MGMLHTSKATLSSLLSAPKREGVATAVLNAWRNSGYKVIPTIHTAIALEFWCTCGRGILHHKAHLGTGWACRIPCQPCKLPSLNPDGALEEVEPYILISSSLLLIPPAQIDLHPFEPTWQLWPFLSIGFLKLSFSFSSISPFHAVLGDHLASTWQVYETTAFSEHLLNQLNHGRKKKHLLMEGLSTIKMWSFGSSSI